MWERMCVHVSIVRVYVHVCVWACGRVDASNIFYFIYIISTSPKPLCPVRFPKGMALSNRSASSSPNCLQITLARY